MLEPRVNPATRIWLERLQALPINAADREQARAEFERAEASTEAMLGIGQRFRGTLAAWFRDFAPRKRWHG